MADPKSPAVICKERLTAAFAEWARRAQKNPEEFTLLATTSDVDYYAGESADYLISILNELYPPVA